ncbi:alpha-N-acetylglucosaminidase TIM-barrel domain-containing protein [Streptomyces sp. AC627_RSS907]|uniref:alpha-N-acetylglucosaminidase TIM-barrel domain-containing protein n=1 Tax=Streptomyces sp. AC627_RSS907 TaxID=2823684 RepID=UPI0020B6D6AD|nr:alpha-N-acetylglucosaminidase TIM-barrel domain-containing protein [Streptomyces sp. AC627_RSS907]
MRQLGIVPILPGFSGTVPPGFAECWAGSRTAAQGRWFEDLVGRYGRTGSTRPPMRTPPWRRCSTPDSERRSAPLAWGRWT